MSIPSPAELDGFLVNVTGRVDTCLRAWTPAADRAGDLTAAMEHIVFSGGKRLRPALVALGALDVGGTLDQAMAPAAAIELVHAYSLVHDDLPCMDDASLRRGKPCVHVVWGEALGVLAGDGLLTLAFEVLARHAEPGAPVGELVAVLAEASGWEGMVGGQVLDLAAEGQAAAGQAPGRSLVEAIHLGKTAALISGALRMGALAGGGNEEDVARLGGIGIDLGVAFQIVDDLLDVEGDTAVLGKAAGADGEAGKATWPAAVGVERARADAGEAVRRAREAGSGGLQSGLLAALGERILSRSH